MEPAKKVITAANKTPLGRPPPTYGSSSKSGGGSLLKPSYLTGGGNGSDSNNSSSSSSSFDPKKHHYEYEQYFNVISSGTGTSSTGNCYKSSTDYSAWSDPSSGFAGFNNSNNAVANLQSSALALSSSGLKRERGNEDNNDGGLADDEARRERKKKRRSRWMGSENEKAVIPGMPTILPSDIPPEQAEAYVSQLQIEELSRKLRTGDLGIPPNPEDRSPSPEPIYGTDGKRLNTREYRTRKKLEEDRHRLIQNLLKLNPEYKPPADYRAPVIKIVDRVPIPQEENPEINFVGLLIGPRGNTLKGLEKDTGAKIIIRGKGSVKEGKVGGKAGHPLPGEDEPLHAYVTSNNPDSVKKACEKIKDIIRQGIEMPESQNDLRKNQLRELALLNGTLREGEGPKCTNCGATSHRTWNCPDKPNITNSVVCTVCGGAGHIAKDCRMKRPGAGGPPVVNPNEKAKIDEEYMSLMAELGEAPPPGANSGSGHGQSHGSSGVGNLFGKPAPLKPLMSAPIRKDWSTNPHPNHPPPPGESPPTPPTKPPPLMSQQISWAGYTQQHQQQQSQSQQSWSGHQSYQQQQPSQQSSWAWTGPPPPVPAPAAQPPPPGMYWQGSSNQPPPPPPDFKPPLPPS